MFTLICGMPRAGKTTMSESYKCKVFHKDYTSLSCIIRNLNTDEDVVAEGIFNRAKDRIKLCEAYNGYTKCVYLDIPVEIRSTRECWSKYCEYFKFESPTLEEGWDEIVIITPDSEKHLYKTS